MSQRFGLSAAAVAPALTALLLGPSTAMALGSLEIDATSFLQSANSRDTSSATLSLGLQGDLRTIHVVGRADVLLNAYTSDFTSVTPEARELYLTTTSSLSPLHEITIGRRNQRWSQMDDAWQAGLWSPRFLWDPFKPEKVGLTGVFWKYKAKLWDMTAFVTGLHIPERGYPVSVADGKISSPSPYAPPVPKSADIGNGSAPISYNLAMPSASRLLFNPGVALHVRHSGPNGLWVSGAGAVMPIQPLEMPVSYVFDIVKSEIDVTLHPRVRYHQMLQAEAGFSGRIGSVWASTMRETPYEANTPSTWSVDPVGTAQIWSAGGDIAFQEIIRLRGSFLFVDEKKPSPTRTSDVSMPSPAFSRFPYTQAFQLGTDFTGMKSFVYSVGFIGDLATRSNLLNFAVQYTSDSRSKKDNPFSDSVWKLGLEAQLIASDTGSGWFGRYSGDSRVIGRVTHAF